MRRLLLLSICVLPGFSVFFTALGGPSENQRDWSKYQIASGKFDRSIHSLQQYEVPEWFRDAKFGIWAIIGPQAVPLQGDWYARNMYIEGSRQNKYHVEHYGHPSKFGYKDIIKLFNPKKLDYDNLLKLYKEAGAKYAVILAVHHDNFDLWNSKYHEWNSVKKTVHRDLVKEFRGAAIKNGLRFGVTTHLARSYSWFQTSHGSDKAGPMKGIPYDGADPKYQGLYHPPFKDNRGYPVNPPEQWELEWFNRVKDLIDSYEPDLMYFDGPYPFPHDNGAVGRQLVAHYYNANMAWHNGRLEAVMNLKHVKPDTCVLDIERGRSGKLTDYVWQTDTCIGNWYYNEHVKYKTVSHVAKMLIDIVSKNGNLLLNIPIHPSGAIDDKEKAFLAGMGKWIKVNGQGIYNTRPWLISGEGGTRFKGGYFRENELSYSAQDLRFTSKGDTDVYVFIMDWPNAGTITVRSMAKDIAGDATISSIKMLGFDRTLKFEWKKDGLKVYLPQTRPCKYAWTLHIKGKKLKDFKAKKTKISLHLRL